LILIRMLACIVGLKIRHCENKSAMWSIPCSLINNHHCRDSLLANRSHHIQ
jgi:hypothetical protein